MASDPGPAARVVNHGSNDRITDRASHPVDELCRATADIARRVQLFQARGEAIHDRYNHEDGDGEERERNLHALREEWAEWQPALDRFVRAVGACAPSLAQYAFNAGDALRALTQLTAIFAEPMIYRPGEQPGDHLLRVGRPLHSDGMLLAWPEDLIAPCVESLRDLAATLYPLRILKANANGPAVKPEHAVLPYLASGKAGRRQKYDPEADKELCERWERRRENGIRQPEFCEDEGITVRDLKLALTRERGRRNEAQKSS